MPPKYVIALDFRILIHKNNRVHSICTISNVFEKNHEQNKEHRVSPMYIRNFSLIRVGNNPRLLCQLEMGLRSIRLWFKGSLLPSKR